MKSWKIKVTEDFMSDSSQNKKKESQKRIQKIIFNQPAKGMYGLLKDIEMLKRLLWFTGEKKLKVKYRKLRACTLFPQKKSSKNI